MDDASAAEMMAFEKMSSMKKANHLREKLQNDLASWVSFGFITQAFADRITCTVLAVQHNAFNAGKEDKE